MDKRCTLHVTVLEALNHFFNVTSDNMRGYGYNSVTANRQYRECEIVVTAVEAEISRRVTDDVSHCITVAARFLHRHNVTDLRQPDNSFRINCHCAPTWNIVKDYGKECRLCNCFIVLIQSFLGRFVIVWCCEHDCIDTRRFRLLCQLDGSPGAV